MPHKSKYKKASRGQGKIHKVMSEFKAGTLRSSSGRKVTNRKQAQAIALSEARRAGAKIPLPPKTKHISRVRKYA